MRQVTVENRVRRVVEAQWLDGLCNVLCPGLEARFQNEFSCLGDAYKQGELCEETGTWSAIWMLPEVNTYGIWPNSGEIDIMEHVGYEEDPLFLAKAGVEQLENVHATLHTQLRNPLANQGIGGKRPLPTASMEFHTYALEWSEDRMEFSIDDEVFLW